MYVEAYLHIQQISGSLGARPSKRREGLVHFKSWTCSSHPTGILGRKNHLEALLIHSVNHALLVNIYVNGPFLLIVKNKSASHFLLRVRLRLGLLSACVHKSEQ